MQLQNLLRLQQLGSANLPVGAYAFSQGLESAVEAGWLNSAEDVEGWLSVQLRYALGRVDFPVYYRLREVLAGRHESSLQHWNDWLLACRESREQRLCDTATGEALARLLGNLNVPLVPVTEPAFLTLYAQAAACWNLDEDASCAVYGWSWMENQVIAATKLLPLGQTRAQQILDRLQGEIPRLLKTSRDLSDHDVGVSLPALAISSCHHETQYSRLFRS